jgi:hypothetical protein
MNTHRFKKFIDKWVGGEQLLPIRDAEVTTLEDSLGTTLPASYREFLTTVGAASMPIALLGSIVDQRLDIADVQEFYSPENVLLTTRAWRKMDLPENLFAIASDGCGNQFCLLIPELGEFVDDDASVWFFDHEEAEAYDMEVPFTEWIDEFANIENTAPPL